jgi:hypothetical protein
MPSLTDLDIRNARPSAAKPLELNDGDGLILIVRTSLSSDALRRAWVLRIVDKGRRRKLGLGRYPEGPRPSACR